MTSYRIRGKQRRDAEWDARAVRELRRHLQLTQRQLAAELNSRQQTVSEWETGRYRPRGPSARLLSLIAEEASFSYQAGQDLRKRARPRSQPPGPSERAGRESPSPAAG
ncbi:MAG: helix-turn-helix domain-containing protein [Dehalococcoidia bacterium]